MNLEWGVAWVWTKPYVVGVLLTVSTGQMTNTAVVPLAVVPFPTAIYITWMGWRGWVAALKLNNWMDGTSTTCWPRGWAGTSSGLLGKVIVVSATLCEYTWQPLMLVLLNRIMLASTNCGSKNELDMCRRQNRKQRIGQNNHELPIESNWNEGLETLNMPMQPNWLSLPVPTMTFRNSQSSCHWQSFA